MTVINVNAWIVSFPFGNNQVPTAVTPVTVSLGFEGSDTTTTYSVIQTTPDDLEVTLTTPGLNTILVDGAPIATAPEDLYAFVSHFTWGNGNAASLLSLNDLDPNNTTEESLLVQIGGDPLPALATLAEFIAFASNVSTGPNMPAGLQAGDVIDLAALPGATQAANTPSDGNDLLIGGSADDQFAGGAGADDIHGGDGNDVAFGDTGNDEIYGGLGDDALRGNAGRDDLYGEEGNDNLKGGKGDDLLVGGAGDDVLLGNKQDDDLFGGAGNDTLKGGNGDDSLNGQGGSDSLSGGKKNDILDGGAGDDLLKGGFGADVFVFTGGADVISDFGKGADKIDIDIELGAEGGTTLAEFLAAYGTQVGADTVFDFDNGNSLTLQDVMLTSLDGNDFVA